MKYLLDTDTAIYFLNGNKKVAANFEKAGLNNIVISTISIAELSFGAYHSKYAESNLERIRLFSSLISVIDYDTTSARFFGLIKSKLRREGKALDDIDILIASVALSSEFTLVTNNLKHFSRVSGLRLQNWA